MKSVVLNNGKFKKLSVVISREKTEEGVIEKESIRKNGSKTS
jgi:hypothetical protein